MENLGLGDPNDQVDDLVVPVERTGNDPPLLVSGVQT